MAGKPYLTKQIVLDRIDNYLKSLDYVPYQQETAKKTRTSDQTFRDYGGYKSLIEELGYEYPRWRASDWTKEEMKAKYLELYREQAPKIDQIGEDYKAGRLPFNVTVIAVKFGTVNAFNKYCGLKLNSKFAQYHSKEEIRDEFLSVYDVDGLPPMQLEMAEDYNEGIISFSVDMLLPKFGSYNNFLLYCGFEEFEGRFSQPCMADDGHICDSRSERDIDNFMYRHSIKHTPHPRYSEFIDGYKPAKKADWQLADGTIVEFFGLMGYDKYEVKVEEKMELLIDNKVPHIIIYPEDLERLEEVFSEYIEVGVECYGL